MASHVSVSGVYPHLSVSADMRPRRSECGIGAVVPWADRLWFITYPAHKAGTGSGHGLYEVTPELELIRRPESIVATNANRLVHTPSGQLVLGAHLIDGERFVRTFDLRDHRLTATMTHLRDPENWVYFLTMEGLLLEGNLHNLSVRQVADLNRELGIPAGAGTHFKGGATSGGKVYVANNTYDAGDERGEPTGGRLACWDGTTWETLAETAFCDVVARRPGGHSPDAELFANGWDRASALLKVRAGGEWRTYRLPKGSHAYDHMWYTEWPRIREVETERLLMDMHGLFYELPPAAYGGRIWGVKPVCQHLRMIPDFCSWRGMLVLAGNQVTALAGNELYVGEPHSNLWFGKVDDLWQFGRPQGWGGPWRQTVVAAGAPSDPFLMTGFPNKTLHLHCHQAEGPVTFAIEVDAIGDGTWGLYDELRVAAGKYLWHAFPPGFGAHWVRLTANAACTATAQFHYA